MKIRITTAPPLAAAYGLTVGSEHTARPNPAKGQEPAWFVDVRHGNNAFPAGIMSYEAEGILDEPADAPARQADEDAKRLVFVLTCVAAGLPVERHATWLRAKLIEWLDSLLYRGALLTYKDESLTVVRDALEKIQL